MGVLPRKTMACSASTRPRIEGSARIWTMAVDAVMNVMLATPMSDADRVGDRHVGREREQQHRHAEAERRDDDVADGIDRSPGRQQRADERADADHRVDQRERRVVAVQGALDEQRHHRLEVERERADDGHHHERHPQLGHRAHVAEAVADLALAARRDGVRAQLAGAHQVQPER